MSGFEVVVRPVVLPNIRPQAPRVLAPASDDPEQGIATFAGSGGGMVDLSYSYQLSSSKTQPHTEVERTYDIDKIYQKNDDGSINRDNNVKVQRTTRTKLKDANGEQLDLIFRYPSPDDNIETIQRNLVYNFKDIVGDIAP